MNALLLVLLFSGLFPLACCIHSVVCPSKKGQVLFKL